MKRLNAICTVNKSFAADNRDEELNNISRVISRKVSLSCEPRFLIPDVKQIQLSAISSSALSSPATKSRFQIISVPESSPRTLSRFKVRILVALFSLSSPFELP